MWRDTETHAGDEKIICHKMKLESSSYLGYQENKSLYLSELCIVLRKGQHNDLSEVKRNILLLKMSCGQKKIFFMLCL